MSVTATVSSAASHPVPSADVTALRAGLGNRLTLPSDPGWDVARQAWNLAVDQRPVAVAEPVSAAEVVAIVAFARERRLRVATQGTGHAAAALGDLDQAILIRTHRMRGVQIDAATRRARAQAGAVWADVSVPAAAHGLAALAGSSADVGVVGYTLSGGVGWLARRYGLAADSVVSIELVTADGRLVVADADHEPDLFWALRGGGGGFGVVTGIELELLPIARLYAGALFFPWERSAEVLGAWLALVGEAPDEMTSVGRILQLPPLDAIPAPLRGRAFAVVEAAHLGDEGEAAALLAPLRALGPELDTFATIAPDALVGLHMDPPFPTPVAGDGALLDDLPAEAIDALVAAAGPASGSTLQSVELRHLGGALGRVREGGGALGRLDGDFLLFAAGVAPDPTAVDAAEARIDAIKGAMRRWDAGHRYLNFVERPGGAHAGFSDATYRRLREVKSEYDPTDLVLAKHPIQPLSRTPRS